jgi:hypothetical protein
MADYKRIINNVLFIALVPTVITASYYGYKAYKSYKKKKKEGEEEGENKEEEMTYEMPPKKESKVNVISELKEEGKVKIETKVIPITRGAKEEEKEEKIEDKKVKEA